MDKDRYATLSLEQKREMLANLLRKGNERSRLLESRIEQVSILAVPEQRKMLDASNNNGSDETFFSPITGPFEAQVEAIPNATALICENQSISFQDLNDQANRVAHYLRNQPCDRIAPPRMKIGPTVKVLQGDVLSLGTNDQQQGPPPYSPQDRGDYQRSAGIVSGTCVGLLISNSPQTVAGLLGILKAGVTALPLPRSYSRDDIASLLPEKGKLVLAPNRSSSPSGPVDLENVISLDLVEEWSLTRKRENQDYRVPNTQWPCFTYLDHSVKPARHVNLEYSHVLNFFKVLNRRIGCQPGDTLLTDLDSADMFSLLHMIWMLSCGGKVVMSAVPKSQEGLGPPKPGNKKPIDFSLLFFSSNEAEFKDDKYQLLVEASKFADRHGFRAVWLPERHFHQVGGLFPNPAVLCAALAMITQQIRLRAGSVVLPLHHPVRVAEEWSVVDNLSRGRVDISFARGWNPNDFVLSPESFSSDNKLLLSRIETVRRLWRGETISLPNAQGEMTEIRIYPLPMQSELSVWLTCFGSPDRFREAAVLGANVLTMLLNQTLEEIGKKIDLYRELRATHGYAPETGTISLMLHTLVHHSMEFVRAKVRDPFLKFIRTTVNLHQQGAKVQGIEMSGAKLDQIAEYAYERYFRTGALFGTPDSCLEMVDFVHHAGIDEIACQIDFGIDNATAMRGLEFLVELKDRFNRLADVSRPKLSDEVSTLRRLIEKYHVSHLSCSNALVHHLTKGPGGINGPVRLKLLITEEGTGRGDPSHLN